MLNEREITCYRHHVEEMACAADGNDNIYDGLCKVLENFQNCIEDEHRNSSQLRTPDHRIRQVMQIIVNSVSP